MALQCLAIIGKVNEPLYLTDVKNSEDAGDENDLEDAFGFAAAHAQEQLSLRREVRLCGDHTMFAASILVILIPSFHIPSCEVHDARINRQS